MADQWTALGIRDMEQAQQLMEKLWPQREMLDLEQGLYVRLPLDEHISFWLSLSRDAQTLLDWEAHYASPLSNGCAFEGDLALDEERQSGSIRVLLRPGEEDIPVEASVVALAPWADRESGSPGLIQLACYASALSLLPGDAEETISCISGTCCAVFCGQVVRALRAFNKLTRQPYWAIEIRSRGVLLHVLAENGMLRDTPAPGALLMAQGRVTAMVESGVIQG